MKKDELMGLLEYWQELMEEHGPAIESIKAVEKKIKEGVRELGGPVQIGRVRCSYSPPRDYDYWDKGKLRELADELEVVSDCREVRTRSAAVAVKLLDA